MKALSQRLASQPEDFEVGWTFVGTRRFVSTDSRLSGDRAWLWALLDAMEKKGRLSIIQAMASVIP